MSGKIVYGYPSKGVLQVGEKFSKDRYNVLSGTRVEIVPDSLVPNGLRALESIHPTFSDLMVTKIDMERKTGGLWEITYTYEGIPWADTTWEFYEAQVEVIGGCREEDSRCHPSFTKLAGSASSPKNGAKFDDDGNFIGFIDDGAGDLYGVQKYLDGSVTCTVTKLGKEPDSVVANLPIVQSPPDGAPSLGSGRNWLLVDVQQVRKGFYWETKKVYRASGMRKWNSQIYS
jgi:hypothetical protein